MNETVITITVADLAALDDYDRSQLLRALPPIWDARARAQRRQQIEPGAIPEPVDAPREVTATPPAGAPGDCPEGTNNITVERTNGSDPSTSGDVAKSEPYQCPECGRTFGSPQGMGGHRFHAHGKPGTEFVRIPRDQLPKEANAPAAKPAPKTGARVGDSTVVMDSKPPKPLPGERWAYTCDNCQRTFPGERTLEEHERTCGRKAS